MPLKKYVLFFVILVATVTLQTCTVDDGPKPCNSTTTYHYLTADQLSKTPYFTNPAFDTISFASDKGDTITFALKKIDTTYYIEDTNMNPNQICSYWQYHQNITATYNTIKGGGSFEVLHAKKALFSFTNGRPTGVIPNLLRFKYNDMLFYVGDFYIGGGKSKTYIFNQREFYNALDYNVEFSDSSNGIIYINQDFGAFHINDVKNKKQFTLINP
jgi:hypothetical protein